MSEQKHTCEEMSGGSMFHRSACGRPARFHEVDRWGSDKLRWFCGIHAPSERKRRQDARHEQRRIEMAPILAAQQKQRRHAVAGLECYKAAIELIQRHDADAKAANFDKCGCDNCKPFRIAIQKAECAS